MMQKVSIEFLLDGFDMLEFFQGHGYIPEFVGGNTEYMLDVCPFCGKEKHCGVSLSKKMVTCFKCHQSMGFFDIIKHITKKSYDDVVLMLQGKIDAKPYDIQSLPELKQEEEEVFDFNTKIIEMPEWYRFLGTERIPYLEKRHISIEQVYRYHIGFCKYGRYRDRLIICDVNDAGKPIYWVARDVTGKVPKAWKCLNPDAGLHGIGSAKIPFNFSLAKRYPVLIITEGVFDALYTGPNAIATYGSTIKRQHVAWMAGQAKFEKVILLYDGDVSIEALEKQANIIASVFPTYICKLDGNSDPDELGKYPAES